MAMISDDFDERPDGMDSRPEVKCRGETKDVEDSGGGSG